MAVTVITEKGAEPIVAEKAQPSDFDELFPVPKTVSLSTGDLTIKPFTFGMLPEVLARSAPFINAYLEATKGGANQQNVMALIIAYHAPIQSFIAFMARENEDVIKELLPNEVVKVLAAVLEVNASFFIQLLRKEIPELVADLTSTLKRHGLMQSSL